MVKYLCEKGADTQTADLGARYVHCDATAFPTMSLTTAGSRKRGDLALLKMLATQATKVEKEIVQILSKQDDFLIEFEFSAIQIAVLDLYDPSDSERPSLEKL